MNSIPLSVDYGLFADDTAILTSSNTTSIVRNRLQESLEGFEKWCASWKLIIQPGKTELLHFSPHPRKKYLNPIHLQVSNINIQPTIICTLSRSYLRSTITLARSYQTC